MNVNKQHWLEGATRATMLGGSDMSKRRFLVIHFTAGATGASSIGYWRELNNGVCAHIVIERDGTVIQCRPFNKTCGHAGVDSKWRDPNTGILYKNLNKCAIGIELANAGNDTGALSWARKQPGFSSIKAKHKFGGSVVEWEAFPAAQLVACAMVARVLVDRYNLDDVIGHEDCAPHRKDDPGPAASDFMTRLRESLGLPKDIPRIN